MIIFDIALDEKTNFCNVCENKAVFIREEPCLSCRVANDNIVILTNFSPAEDSEIFEDND